MQLLNVGCGPHYVNGWTNADIYYRENDCTPDVVVHPEKRYPFPDGTFDKIYIGHMLEHVEKNRVEWFLLEMKRIAKTGADVMIVGPDVLKAIERYKQGTEPLSIVIACLESETPGGHQWNCTGDRVMDLLLECAFSDIRNVEDNIQTFQSSWLDRGTDWPVKQFSPWQFAIRCQA